MSNKLIKNNNKVAMVASKFTRERSNNIQQIKCCICGKRIPVIESNNPYPVKKWSALGSDKNRCCHSCNSNFVAPYRMMLCEIAKGEVDMFLEMLQSLTYKELVETTEQVFGKGVA